MAPHGKILIPLAGGVLMAPHGKILIPLAGGVLMAPPGKILIPLAEGVLTPHFLPPRHKNKNPDDGTHRGF